MRHYSVKYRATGYLFATLLAFLGTSPAHAAIIHESATIDNVGQAPTVLAVNVVSALQYLGSRFSITSPMQVSAIGGHFVKINPPGDGKVFGAIVNVTDVAPPGPSNGDFPPFLPATIGANALAATTLDLPTPTSAGVTVPLSVLLSPGDYALIFGAGGFGAGGNGQMPINNDVSGAFNPSPPSFFFGLVPSPGVSGEGNWFDFNPEAGIPNFYFVVEGTVVPIPPAFGLFAAGLLALGFIVRRQRRAI